MGMTYSGIRKAQKMTSAAKKNSYRDGGGVKNGKTTINIVVPQSRGEQASAPIAPMGSGAGLPPMPPAPSAPPVPPVVGNAALKDMGSGPQMKRGGKVSGYANGGSVKMKAGAESGLGRLEKIKAYGAKAKVKG